jgi:PTH1 family peptidyl-tRNA hydrolase
VKLIVGLGNPGIPYQWSRHNIGFQVIDRLAEMKHIYVCTRRFKTLYGMGWIDSQKVVLAKPMTYMNLSGVAVKRVVDFFHMGMEDLIVIHDDLDLPFGRLRIKQRGGDGGHQGIRSIIESMGGKSFLRLKVGIGRPPKGMDPREYVLSNFDEIEQSNLDGALSKAAESLVVILLEGVATAMNRYQRKGKIEEG